MVEIEICTLYHVTSMSIMNAPKTPVNLTKLVYFENEYCVFKTMYCYIIC